MQKNWGLCIPIRITHEIAHVCFTKKIWCLRSQWVDVGLICCAECGFLNVMDTQTASFLKGVKISLLELSSKDSFWWSNQVMCLVVWSTFGIRLSPSLLSRAEPQNIHVKLSADLSHFNHFSTKTLQTKPLLDIKVHNSSSLKIPLLDSRSSTTLNRRNYGSDMTSSSYPCRRVASRA